MEDNIIVERYAPVMIPTLCRYEHFKKLMESLDACTWADKTDVYIGLDYPAKESHKEGWEKIKQYLSERKFCFNKLVVFERDHNCGVNGDSSNLELLRKYVMERYDRWILSEDDNVFSPNFLVFINKGLEKFKDDKTVYAINGYRHFYNVKFADNTFFRQNVDFSAWGYGMWNDRYEELRTRLTRKYLRQCLFKRDKWKNVWRNGWFKRCAFVQNATSHRHICYEDWIQGLYMTIENLDVVMPRISTVRNEGWDNSGVNCQTEEWGEIAERHNKQEIDGENSFNFVGTGLENYELNRSIYIGEHYETSNAFNFSIQLLKGMVKLLLRK